MIKFKVKVSGTEEGKRQTIDKSKLVLMKCMFKMEELAIDYAPFDTGYLKARITVFPQILAGHYVLTSHASYSAAMEYGSRPFYAPIKPLTEWAARQLGDEKLGYAVRAKIAKFGVRAQPYMRPSLAMINSFWMPIYMKEVFGAES